MNHHPKSIAQRCAGFLFKEALPLDRAIVPPPLGPPVAALEIVLLLKAFHNPPRPKDKRDLLFARKRFTSEQRAWLRTHLARLLHGHRWLPLLA